MTGSPLDPFLRPASIAVLGASRDPARISGKPLRFLRELGYAGRVYPVNPRYDEVNGWPCFASVEALPEAPDLVVVALPARLVLPSLEQCARRGARAALIFTAGFAEAGPDGAAQQARLAELARRSGMRICGPNCIGLLNLHNGVAATFSSSLEDRAPRPGGVSFVTQSGAFGSFYFGAASRAGLGFSSWINTGNEVDLELAECLEHYVDDSDTQVISLWAEGFRDGPRLRRAAEAARLAGKPVLLLKIGRSHSGARAAVSHTAALASDDRIVDGVCRQHGIVRVETVQELQDAARGCSSPRLPAGPGVALITISGGAGVFLADECARRGLEVAELAAARVARLRALLPWYASASNPIDTTAQLMNEPANFQTVLEILAEDPAVHSLVVFMGLQPLIAERIARATAEVAAAIDKPVLVTWMLAPPIVGEVLDAARVPLYEDPSSCITGLAALVRSAEARRRAPRRLTAEPELLSELAASLMDEAARASEVRWSEPRTRALLAQYGLTGPRECVVRSVEQAVAKARQLGWPVVLKLVAASLFHKARAGAVRLGLRTDDDVRLAATTLLQLGEQHPEWGVEGVLVQEQLPPGLELLLGVRTDPTFGSTVCLGLGGAQAELLDDLVVRPVPLVADDVEDMLAQLRAGPGLLAARARGAWDSRAVTRAVLGLSRLATDLASLDLELDVNPLLVRPAGQQAIVLDAALTARPLAKGIAGLWSR